MDIINETSSTSKDVHDECHLSEEEIKHAYNLTLHIVSVFVLLVASFLGASLSVASARVKAFHISPIVLNIGKFFGSGVVLATGFIHILPEAMETLSDSCLPDSWNEYSAYGGLFAMIAILLMQLIEFLAHEKYRSMNLKHSHTDTNSNNQESEQKTQIDQKTEEPEKIQSPNNNVERSEPINHVHYHHHHHHHDGGENHGHVDIIQMEPPITSLEQCAESNHHHHGLAFQNDNQQNKISTYLLEFGIALHSVLIGLTLGTTTDSFVALFIALCFHQFFEAIALGAQIANLKSTSTKSAIFMVIFFSLTTPLGIGIGIGIHSGTYNPKSVSYLLSTGILDSFSAGILIYVALVNLITAEMGANAHAFHNSSRRLKFVYFVALYLGAAAMAVIGRWA
ncbi:hypothetical protein I4U23_008869 [Adineta vaga]|nr:hypothetical protein I4U23_008869 [Adineta vaga]